jgi:hypothetical protein
MFRWLALAYIVAVLVFTAKAKSEKLNFDFKHQEQFLNVGSPPRI